MALLNSQKKQIQTILKEIDEVLNQPSTSDASEILKATLRKSHTILKQILDYETQEIESISSSQKSQESLGSLGHNIQGDLKILQQQRQALLEEIKQLEKQRQHNYSLAQQYAKQQQIISEFSQALLGPLQERLVEQLSQLTNQHPSQIQSSLTSSQEGHPQNIKDIETSDLITIPVDQLEDDSNFSESFVDESNQEDSSINLPVKINQTEPKLIHQKKELNDQKNETVFPYPGYEFFTTQNQESTIREEESITSNEFMSEKNLIQEKSSSSKDSNLQEVENNDQSNTDLFTENALDSHIKAPSFEEDYSEEENNQNQKPKIEDKKETDNQESRPANISNFDQTENIESDEIESLSHLFGELEIYQKESEPLVIPEEKSHQTTVKENKSEKDKYIQASATENLLPVEEQEEAQSRELLLDTNIMEQLRSDLVNLEEINPDESILDDPGATILQFEECQPLSSGKNLTNEIDNSFNLEDLFGSISEDSNTNNPDIFSPDEEEIKNEQTIEDILDSLTSSTEEKQAEPEIESDNQNFIDLESLLQDTPDQEKKNLINHRQQQKMN